MAAAAALNLPDCLRRRSRERPLYRRSIPLQRRIRKARRRQLAILRYRRRNQGREEYPKADTTVPDYGEQRIVGFTGARNVRWRYHSLKEPHHGTGGNRIVPALILRSLGAFPGVDEHCSKVAENVILRKFHYERSSVTMEQTRL